MKNRLSASAFTVVLIAVLLELVVAIVWDGLIVRDSNCDSGDAAVCVETLGFLED